MHVQYPCTYINQAYQSNNETFLQCLMSNMDFVASSDFGTFCIKMMKVSIAVKVNSNGNDFRERQREIDERRNSLNVKAEKKKKKKKDKEKKEEDRRWPEKRTEESASGSSGKISSPQNKEACEDKEEDVAKSETPPKHVESTKERECEKLRICILSTSKKMQKILY